MSDYERQRQIMEILNEKKSVSIDKLVKLLYVSPATVRRDLKDMANQGLIKRTHGGAILFASTNEESSNLIRMELMKKEKRDICEKCIDYIKNNQSIFLDSSSTVCYLIPLLNNFQYLTLVTNGLTAATLIGKKTQFKVFVPSGFVKNQSNSIVGDAACQTVNSLYCDVFIFSCAGISIERGITEASIEQTEIKKAMMKNSGLKILLVDSSKFDKVYLSKTCDVDDVDIVITDSNPSEEIMLYFENSKTQLVVVNKTN